MYRRTPFYAELLYRMRTCPNPFEYSGPDLDRYKFAVLKNISRDQSERRITCNQQERIRSMRPAVISDDVEDEPMSEVIGNLHNVDLVLVPLSQVRPS